MYLCQVRNSNGKRKTENKWDGSAIISAAVTIYRRNMQAVRVPLSCGESTIEFNVFGVPAYVQLSRLAQHKVTQTTFSYFSINYNNVVRATPSSKWYVAWSLQPLVEHDLCHNGSNVDTSRYLKLGNGTRRPKSEHRRALRSQICYKLIHHMTSIKKHHMVVIYELLSFGPFQRSSAQ